MNNFQCALLKYEVPSEIDGALSLKGILLDGAIDICKHCLDTRGDKLLCHPIIVKTSPEVPMPFLVLVDEPVFEP